MRNKLISVHQMVCVLVYGLFHSMLEEKQDLHYLLKRMHFCYEMLGLNRMLELKSSMYNIHKFLDLLHALMDLRETK